MGDRYKVRAVYFISATAIATLLVFIPVNLYRQLPTLAMGNVILSLILALNLALFHKHRSIFLMASIGLVCVIGTTIYFIYAIGMQIYFWIFIIPVALFLLLGRRIGAIMVALCSLAFIAVYFFIPETRTEAHLPELDILFGFGVLTVLAYISEYINDLNRTELHKLSNTDMLTGAWNRRKFDDIFRREIGLVQRYGHPLALILFDIDHFKEVNDRFGHIKGDELLQELVAITGRMIRNEDYLFRWGGEEFMILLPCTNLPSGIQLAERIRSRLANHVFAHVRRISVSLGVAEYNVAEYEAIARAASPSDYLIQLADHALYQAKANGRNRVEYATGRQLPDG